MLPAGHGESDGKVCKWVAGRVFLSGDRLQLDIEKLQLGNGSNWNSLSIVLM